MTLDVIAQRLARYECSTVQDYDHALREIAQNVALAALSRAGFFKLAAFHGGTCLRVFHGLPRFSEDLDFASLGNLPDFDWRVYATALTREFEAFGYAIELQAHVAQGNVRKAMVKDGTLVSALAVRPVDQTGRMRALRVKLEVDVRPPAGASTTVRFLDFPLPLPVTVHDLPSCFAGKLHALLCRSYVKGRDWFDFLWYAGQGTPFNRRLLAAALAQTGPWAGSPLPFGDEWVRERLVEAVKGLDLSAVHDEVRRFLKPRDAEVVESWTGELLIERVGRVQGQ